MKISVDFLWIDKEVKHLPDSVLEIHLLKVAELF